METAITLCILYQSFTLFSDVTREEVVILLGLMEVILIYKIITRIVRRVDINHLHLAHIGVLEQFEHFQIITLNIEVLGILPVYTLLRVRAQGLADGLGCLLKGSTFAHPSEVVTLITLSDIITQQQAQFLEINCVFYLTRLWVFAFRKALRTNLIERIHVQLCATRCFLF